jgi:hypothetical protein
MEQQTQTTAKMLLYLVMLFSLTARHGCERRHITLWYMQEVWILVVGLRVLRYVST